MPSPFARRAARARARRSRNKASSQINRAGEGGAVLGYSLLSEERRTLLEGGPRTARRSAPARCIKSRTGEADPLPLPPYVCTTATSRDSHAVSNVETVDLPAPSGPRIATVRPPCGIV